MAESGKMKTLAKETAIYGLSSIIGRFLNWCLVPMYTYVLADASEYGIVTNIYAWTALLLVFLTYGMETGFFRYVNKEADRAATVYGTTLFSIASTSLLFIALVFLFDSQIASAMGTAYVNHTEFITIMGVVVAIDAFTAIPFAYLRYQKKAVKFAVFKLLMIFINIVLNIFFLVVCPKIWASNPSLIDWFYVPDYGVGYIIVANFISTAATLVMLLPSIMEAKFKPDFALLRSMLKYSLPLLVLGIAGIMNQTVDKILFPYLCEGEEGMRQLGIYGACFKVAMVMMMFTQAFRYAYEPFVFGKSKDKDNRDTYAKAMKYFIIFTLLAFLLVVGYMDILRHIIGRDYWSGLRVVPIVMAAEIMMGIYFNLSFWYKLIDKTIWGAWFSGIGCAVLIAVNLIFVPRYGYMACAWAGFAGYGTAMVISYLVGQKHYPINYPLKDIAIYTLIAVVFFWLMVMANSHLGLGALATNTLLVVLFAAFIAKKEGLKIRKR